MHSWRKRTLSLTLGPQTLSYSLLTGTFLLPQPPLPQCSCDHLVVCLIAQADSHQRMVLSSQAHTSNTQANTNDGRGDWAWKQLTTQSLCQIPRALSAPLCPSLAAGPVPSPALPLHPASVRCKEPARWPSWSLSSQPWLQAAEDSSSAWGHHKYMAGTMTRDTLFLLGLPGHLFYWGLAEQLQSRMLEPQSLGPVLG